MKKCGSCKEIKPKVDFYKNYSKKDGLGSYCKKCNTLWVRKRYLCNKKYYDEKNKISIRRNKNFIMDFLKSQACVDCGEKNPIVLEFDHKGEKRNSICNMIKGSYSINSIKKEIQVCEIRCANCHRIKTANDYKYYKSK